MKEKYQNACRQHLNTLLLQRGYDDRKNNIYSTIKKGGQYD